MLFKPFSYDTFFFVCLSARDNIGKQNILVVNLIVRIIRFAENSKGKIIDKAYNMEESWIEKSLKGKALVNYILFILLTEKVTGLTYQF